MSMVSDPSVAGMQPPVIVSPNKTSDHDMNSASAAARRRRARLTALRYEDILFSSSWLTLARIGSTRSILLDSAWLCWAQLVLARLDSVGKERRGEDKRKEMPAKKREARGGPPDQPTRRGRVIRA